MKRILVGIMLGLLLVGISSGATYDANTRAMLHLNNSFTDEIGGTWSGSNTFAPTSSAFGGYEGSFDGNSYIQNQSQLMFVNSMCGDEWTVDMRVNKTDSASPLQGRLFQARNATQAGNLMTISITGASSYGTVPAYSLMVFDYNQNTNRVYAPFPIEYYNHPHHISITGDGSCGVKIFLNGTEVASGTLLPQSSGYTKYTIGGGYDFTGTIDEIRLSNVVRQTSDFVPPPVEYPVAMYANFTASNTSGIQPLYVEFTDTSIPTEIKIDSWAWDFGDGNTSILQSPSHLYEVPGTHTANLTITNTSYSLVSTKLSNITVYNRPPVANFDMNETSGLPPLAVQFTDTSTGVIDSWSWDFGEGNTSILQNPEHTFGSGGEYQVNLTVTNDGGISTKLQNITVYCAEFSGAPTIGTIPLLVTFTDLTTGGPTAWNWSFGDGTFSELQNPTHTYTTLGTYTVNLTSTIMGGDCTESKTNYIIAGITAAPTVAFTANRTEGASPFVVQFTDQSTQSPNAWNWSFGGDGYSDDQNPIHTFATPGTYWINLTATNPLGSGYLNKSAYITVKAAGTTIVDFSAVPTSGSPGVLVQFTDMSVVTSTSSLAYNWSFGDGTYSDTAGNVQHVYSYASVYDVNLTITNNVSKEFEFKQQYITISVSDKTTWYTPVQVPIRVFNEYGAPIVGILVSATPQNFTAPADWAETLIGVNPMVNISGTTVSGFTGTDGSWVAPVLQSQYYRFVFSNGTAGIHHEASFYPSDPSYRIFITTGVAANNTYTQITNTNLTFSQPNASYITMGMNYQDTSTLTGNVTFTVSDWKNGTVYYEQTFTSGYVTSAVTSSYTTPNVRGDEFVWKYVAYRSDGSVMSQANSLLAKGPSGVMVDLGLPSVDWYQWISVFILFLVGSLSSQRTKQYWAILIPVFASLFLWWGWFGIGIETVVGGLVIFCAVLGVIIYMKASLREKHGVGGPGSMILNIVFYLLVLQACIGFVNGIGVWDATDAVAVDSPYKNVDITKDIPAIENAGGGMNDVAAVSLILWDMGFSLMRVLWQIISAIAFIYPTLVTMFPFLVGSQQTLDLLLLLQIGIWVAYALFAYKFVKGEIGTLEL